MSTMDSFAMRQTAQRLLRSEDVRCQANAVVRTGRFKEVDGQEQFEAVQFASDGSAVVGHWLPDRDWAYPSDVAEGEPGTFTPEN